MTRALETIRRLRGPSARFWRFLFGRRRAAAAPLADPLHCDVPWLRDAEIAAVYNAQRIAGDFYEFQRVAPNRMLFGLLDAAGRRADTRDILIAAQSTFRTLVPRLFAGDDFNEADAMMELCHQMNRTILRVGGIHSCPAFFGCYNEDLGTVCYANAGYTPGLLRDKTGITLLEATGLPLGLFSHATQSASPCALVPGAALLVVSRGLIEAEYNGEEFGLQGVRENLQSAAAPSAQDLCLATLDAAQTFTRVPPTHNDMTALALVRRVSSERARTDSQRGAKQVWVERLPAIGRHRAGA